ncbi:MAG: serine hydrolase [Gemmatimonadetes bacterium]|uniref:Serine hydrolase n=1 Tax=Candidatus Kutchimonas denitrificans TaxID=3056748 RepID=A0AAE4Z7I0_9BACT|nr:serine hydrolase [Gemmatimonadota bacterium]NIR73671.1 serine hydrolase [Candidatus Kutchimonas denitrificans]NIS00721.1 serine hydrolase [Gemmatimonadota bacterium]NIT66308.1 serine hydrolase [Gemmatimonadota bacterium]NIU51526.1 serine hydrolase [Gemmatimonadota bacterium]
MHTRWNVPQWFVVLPLLASVGEPVIAQEAPANREARTFAAGFNAHHICAGIFVVGRVYERDAETVFQEDVVRFPDFGWRDDFRYQVDWEDRSVTVSGDDIAPQTAEYFGDQGCVILPEGADSVYFVPVDVTSTLPDPATQPWPTGDLDATGPPPPEIDRAALERALDAGLAAEGQNTRAIVVVYKGKIIGERYAPGWTKDTPQISWSMGKSLTAALFAILVGEGLYDVDDPAPIAAWHGSGDPRAEIRIKDLLRMSSGLDFDNFGVSDERSWSRANEHFLIYFDAVDVFEHAIDQPLRFPPNTEWRYRNSDPLTIGRVVRETVEGRGGNYHTFPQRALFDRIGMRNVVLETDAWGNFILTGYDFASARDWARFGLLHLWDGVWEGERVLPDGWVEFITTPAPANEGLAYGGLWWLNRGGALDRVPRDAYFAAGYMGQRTLVIPSRDMVIVRLGPNPGDSITSLNDLAGDVLDAVRVTADVGCGR